MIPLINPEYVLRRALLPALATFVVSCRAPQTSVSSATPMQAAASRDTVGVGVRVEQSGRAASEQRLEPAITAADLDRRTAELFGDAQHVESMRIPFDSGLMNAMEAEPTWDIEVRSYETLARVQHYVALFTHGERHGMPLGAGVLLLITVGALPPDPVRPWHPAHPFRI